MKRLSLFVLILLIPALAPAQSSQVGGRTSPDQAEALTIDLPGNEHRKNLAGRDGAGCCVFASITHSGRWANVEALYDFLDKVAKNERGGGWPEKVDKL